MLFCLMLAISSIAQQSTFYTSATIGIASPVLDNGVGFHVGVHPSTTLTDRLSFDSQISYLCTDVKSGFLSGGDFNIHSFNMLGGGRFYFNSSEKTNRFYINLLLGGNYNVESNGVVTIDRNFKLGFSTGAFVKLKRLLLGISFDAPQHRVFKVGYQL